jgi:hypothetical protein
MITFIIAVGVGGGAFAAAYYAADFGLGWSIFCALAGFGVFQAIAGIAIQKRVKAEMEKVQAILVAGQQKLQEKMNRWQMRPPGSIQAAQKELADNTRVFVKEAIVQADSLNKFKLWVPMMDRQIATAKLQLN